MSSSINPTSIDGTYPVAGQDNDSQGFRDNFTNIQNNFTYAAAEISDLQSKAVLKSALTGTTLNNNMGYSVLQNAQLFSPSYTYLNQGTASTGTLLVDYSLASVQYIQLIAASTLGFASTWPTTGQYAAVSVIFNITNVAYTLTLPSTVTVGVTDIAGWTSSTGGGTITFDQPGVYVFEFSTVNAGTNITIRDLTRNRASLRDPNLYFNDTVVTTLFVGFENALANAVLSDAGRDTVMASGSYSSASFGNLALANVVYSTLDSGPLAGYNITSARGNLQTLNFLPVQSNDQLGYINAVTFTGNGTANTFNQSSRIGFYATGSNLITGLGGNIAFFTAASGNGVNQYAVSQAVGIENDQSVAVFGNLLTKAGKIDQGYQVISSPSAAFWANINPGISRLIIDNTTTLATGNVSLPNTAIDGTVVRISSANTVTAFGANTLNSVAVRPNNTYTLSAGSGVEYLYRASNSTWYKVN
jgi:hypothetical protein